MKQIELSSAQRAAGEKLGEGLVVFAYRDGNTIRMETARGKDPWVWRGGEWRMMK